MYLRIQGLLEHFCQHSKQIIKKKLKLAQTKIDFTNHNKHSILRNDVKTLLICIAISVNVQVYTTSNIIMSIQIVSIRINVIVLATTILSVQIQSNYNKIMNEINDLTKLKIK